MVNPLLMIMDELPQALLSDVLSRVSIESLLRYRCICKHWREIIDDSYFRNSLHRVKEHVLLSHEFEEEKIYLLKTHENAPMEKILISKFPELKDYEIQGACNGLLLFTHKSYDENNPELLINPLTKEIWRLPRATDLQPHLSVYGLGLDCPTNTYKMVQIGKIVFDEKTHSCTMGARVYDFKKRSWRTCKVPPPFQDTCPKNFTFTSRHLFIPGPRRNFVFASGALNWFLEENPGNAREMLTFDLTKEEFNLISVPAVFFERGRRWGRMGMRELGGSLALVHYYPNNTRLDVWVLRDYTRKEWTMKYTIQLPCADCSYYVVGSNKGDKLMLLTRRYGHWDRELMTYDVNEVKITTCRAKDIGPRLFCATLSLVSLE